MALSTTFAGNLTTRYGIPVTILTTVTGVTVLLLLG